MGFIRQKWADITDRSTVNGTIVVEFVRTDVTGPIWQCRCSCGESFFLPHSRIFAALESNAPVYCGQCIVPTAKTATRGEILRAEHDAAKEAEREAAERQAKAVADAAREAAIRAEKVRYLKFAQAQIRAGVMPDQEQFVSFKRWLQQGEHWREDVLQRIAA